MSTVLSVVSHGIDRDSQHPSQFLMTRSVECLRENIRRQGKDGRVYDKLLRKLEGNCKYSDSTIGYIYKEGKAQILALGQTQHL